MKPIPADQPTRKNIENLLNELLKECNGHRGPQHGQLGKLKEKYDELHKQACDLEESLLKDKQLARLKQHRDLAYQEYESARKSWLAKVRSVRQAFLANGVTPKVQALVNELVAEAN